jgi:hypothetical protein
VRRVAVIGAGIAVWVATFLVLVEIGFILGGSDCTVRKCNQFGEFFVGDGGTALVWVFRLIALVLAVMAARALNRRVSARSAATAYGDKR